MRFDAIHFVDQLRENRCFGNQNLCLFQAPAQERRLQEAALSCEPRYRAGKGVC